MGISMSESCLQSINSIDIHDEMFDLDEDKDKSMESFDSNQIQL